MHGEVTPTKARKQVKTIYDACLHCDCSDASGCRLEQPKKTRKYVMKKPRGRRGPYKIATAR